MSEPFVPLLVPLVSRPTNSPVPETIRAPESPPLEKVPFSLSCGRIASSRDSNTPTMKYFRTNDMNRERVPTVVPVAEPFLRTRQVRSPLEYELLGSLTRSAVIVEMPPRARRPLLGWVKSVGAPIWSNMRALTSVSLWLDPGGETYMSHLRMACSLAVLEYQASVCCYLLVRLEKLSGAYYDIAVQRCLPAGDSHLLSLILSEFLVISSSLVILFQVYSTTRDSRGVTGRGGESCSRQKEPGTPLFPPFL